MIIYKQSIVLGLKQSAVKFIAVILIYMTFVKEYQQLFWNPSKTYSILVWWLILVAKNICAAYEGCACPQTQSWKRWVSMH